jgi:hypothetical protein
LGATGSDRGKDRTPIVGESLSHPPDLTNLLE